MAKRDSRKFAIARNRSDIRVVSRSTKGYVATVVPHKFYKYHGNAAAIDNKSFKRRK